MQRHACRRLFPSLVAVTLLAGLFALPAWAGEQEVGEQATVAMAAQGDCAAAVSLLEEQNKMLSREFRQLKREMAILRQDLQKPGLPEIIGGIGYILGLCGIWAYVSSRKKAATS